MEEKFIDWLRGRLRMTAAVELGLGDDAAILNVTPGQRMVVTTDALSDGVDFHLLPLDEREDHLGDRLGSATARQVGYKALAANLSDLAAMAARPLAAFVSLILPRTNAFRLAQEIFEGLIPLADAHQVAIAGGDTNTWDQGLVISITAIGETQVIRTGPVTTGASSWRRVGAEPGDALFATGAFGGSLLKRHLHPEPRLAEATYLARHYQIHAAMDVSDGLSLDISRLARESRVGVKLYPHAIPIADDARTMSQMPGDSRSALEHAMGDGEDFELIMAVPVEDARRMELDAQLPVRCTRIGHFIRRPGLWVPAALATGVLATGVLATGVLATFSEASLESQGGDDLTAWVPFAPLGFRHQEAKAETKSARTHSS